MKTFTVKVTNIPTGKFCNGCQFIHHCRNSSFCCLLNSRVDGVVCDDGSSMHGLDSWVKDSSCPSLKESK